MERLRAMADMAVTDLTAANAQVTSLGSLIAQERAFKAQVLGACQDKATRFSKESLARQEQLRVVGVALDLVHGNIDALQRYLQGKPPEPPPGLKPGESSEYANPKAAKMADAQKAAAKAELEEEKKEFASIFGGDATGGAGLVHEKETDDKASAATGIDDVACEDGQVWCGETSQCIDPESMVCASIEVVKGDSGVDAVAQGERAALVFHDSEAALAKRLQLKTSEEALKYEATKSQNAAANRRAEEKMKKDLATRKSEEQAEKKRFKSDTEKLNKLQHQCADARTKQQTAKEALHKAEAELLKATDRLRDVDDAFTRKRDECSTYSNETATVRASGENGINSRRDGTYENVQALVAVEKLLNASETALAQLSAMNVAKSDLVTSLEGKMAQATAAREAAAAQQSKLDCAKNEDPAATSQECRVAKQAFEEAQLEELKLQQKHAAAADELSMTKKARELKASEVSTHKRKAQALEASTQGAELAAESAKKDLEARLKTLIEDLHYCEKERDKLKSERDEERAAKESWTTVKDKREMESTDSQLAADEVCAEKNKFKFKRQEGLEASVLDLAPLPEQVPLTGLACGLYQDCVSCTADVRCGYASLEGIPGVPGSQPDAVCMRGAQEGPYFFNATTQGKIAGWFYQTCPVARCRDCK